MITNKSIVINRTIAKLVYDSIFNGILSVDLLVECKRLNSIIPSSPQFNHPLFFPNF
jgi:hypothetical protein